MSWYGILVVVHVLLLVYWLGADLGVFYAARFLLRRDLSPEARGTAAKILLGLDLSPRICLVLMLPVGLSLAATVGVSRIGGGWLAVVWVVALAWLIIVLAVHREQGPVWRQIDLGIRIVLIVVLGGCVALSLAANGPFATTWLTWKVAAYTVAVSCGVAIRFALRPLGPALGALLSTGATPQVDETLSRTLRSTYPYVFTIWAMLISAAVLGVVKP